MLQTDIVTWNLRILVPSRTPPNVANGHCNFLNCMHPIKSKKTTKKPSKFILLQMKINGLSYNFSFQRYLPYSLNSLLKKRECYHIFKIPFVRKMYFSCARMHIVLNLPSIVTEQVLPRWCWPSFLNSSATTYSALGLQEQKSQDLTAKWHPAMFFMAEYKRTRQFLLLSNDHEKSPLFPNTTCIYHKHSSFVQKNNYKFQCLI